MSRVTSLASISDQQLDRLIRRIGLLLLIGTVVFVGFYMFDRWRPPQPSMVTREMAALELAVRENPADIASRGRLADVYVIARMYPEAIAQYDAILVTGQADKAAYLGRGKAHQASGALAAAGADFQAVVDMSKDAEMANVDPMLQAAYFWLGRIALDQGRSAEAVTALSAAVQINRADADTIYLLGTAYVGTGDTDKAVEMLRRAIAFVPYGWPEPYISLEQAYAAAGDTAMAGWAGAMAAFAAGDDVTAEAGLLSILEGAAAVDARIGLGLVMEGRGEPEAAAAWFRQALALDPENRAAQLALARVEAEDRVQMPALPHPGTLPGGDGS
jgi:tetratricopeptide (TPR) repeat protein